MVVLKKIVFLAEKIFQKRLLRLRQNFRVSFLKKMPIFYVRQAIILTFSSGSAKIITVNIFRLKARRRKQMIKYGKKSIFKSGVRKIALFAGVRGGVFICVFMRGRSGMRSVCSTGGFVGT